MRKLAWLFLLLFPALAYGQGFPAPVACPQFFAANGTPLAGGFLFTFRTGTLIPQPSYTDSTISTPNSNPIQLDAGGFATSPSGSCGIWLDPALTYTFTLRSAQNVQQWSVDGITGSNFSVLLNQSNIWTQVQTFTGGIVVTGPANFTNVGISGVAQIANILCTSLENIQCVDPSNSQHWPGSDAGAWINAAYASLPGTGGDILLAAGSYSQSTTINFATPGKPARIVGAPGATTLTLTVNNISAFNYNVAGVAGSHLWGGGLENITLVGPGSSTNSTGIFLGGANGAEGVVRRNVKVAGFGTGEKYDNNTYLTECLHCVFIDNGMNLNIPSGITNSGESFSYIDSAFANSSGANNGSCVTVSSPVNNLSFTGGSFDNCQLLVHAGQIHVMDVHFENPNSGMAVAFIAMDGGRLSLINPDFQWDNFAAPTPSTAVGCSAGLLTTNNETFFSGTTTITSNYLLSGTCEFHETGLKLTSGFTNFYLTSTSGAISTFGNQWASNQLIGAGDMLMSGSKLKLGPLNQNYYTFAPANPATFRQIFINDAGADFIMGASLNSASGAYQSKRGITGCTTGAGAGNSCSTTVTWPQAFPGTNYSVSCSPSGGPTNFPSSIWTTTKTTTTATINYQAGTAAAATWAFIDCIGIMD